MRLLLEEHLSPTLVRRLAEIGVFAQAVPHIGLAGAPDQSVWDYAWANDMVVATANFRDFLDLAVRDIHAGLIVLQDARLNRDEQFARLEPVIRWAKESTDPDFLLNKVVVVDGPNNFRTLDLGL